MPELPEVETIVRQLGQVLPGRTITRVKVYREKSAPTELSSLSGRTVTTVKRKAKMFYLSFRDWNCHLLGHLKMTGQLVFRDTGGKQIFGGHPTPDWVEQLPSKHTRIEIEFTDTSMLYFNDQRVFGWLKIVENDELLKLIMKLPPDVVEPAFTVEYLTSVVKKSQRALKLVLLDQSKIGGLGNIYVNDALWLAHTKPTRKAKTLTKTEIVELYKALVTVIERGITLGGASETNYVHITGLGGKYQEEFLVYKRDGLNCLRKDGGIIEKISIGGRGSYFCPVCQK